MGRRVVLVVAVVLMSSASAWAKGIYGQGDAAGVESKSVTGGRITLVREDAEKCIFMPRAAPGGDWEWWSGGAEPFDDSGWNDGNYIPGMPGGVGYDLEFDYLPYISYDMNDLMNGRTNPSANSSCFIRIPFELDASDLAEFTVLTLGIQYDDGFAAYINGVEVKRSDNVPAELAWNSSALLNHELVGVAAFEISEHIDKLHAGDNILAIHGMNIRPTSSDFLISVELAAWPGISTNEIICVDADARGASSGANWENALRDLQEALSYCYLFPELREIRVAAGTYRPAGDGDRSAAFQLVNGVTLKGGYAGYGEPDPNVRDVNEYETILSGDLYGNDDDYEYPPPPDENSHHVVSGSGTDATAVMDGFTIARGTGGGMYGGGMYNYGGSPSVKNCTFFNNRAYGGGGMYNDSNSNPTLTDCNFTWNTYDNAGGGGMYNDLNSSPTLINCTFSANGLYDHGVLPEGRGGGMYNSDGRITLENCTFNMNDARYGGGMYNDSNSNPALTNCTFTANAAYGGDGGGMYNDSNSSLTLIDCNFTGNQATYMWHPDARDPDPACGGGMYNYANNATLENCKFAANTARLGGGMCNGANSTPTLTNCTFERNESLVPTVSLPTGGGGMYNEESEPDLQDCSFSNNSGPTGGGMYNYLSDPRVSDCNFTGNQADFGGGMANYRGDPRVSDCNFSGNHAYSGGGMYNEGTGGRFGDPDEAKAILANCTLVGNVASYSGGGMFNSSYGSPTLINCVLRGNVAEEENGGGMYNDSDSSPTLIDCSFEENEANSPNIGYPGHGGGMYNYESEPELTDCNFTGNRANVGGGLFNTVGYSNDIFNPRLINCTFVGNAADYDGGGMYNDMMGPTLTDCTFLENSAEKGGGMYNVRSGSSWQIRYPELTNCTFNHNVAVEGGGIYEDKGGSAVIVHSTFRSNYADVGGGMNSGSNICCGVSQSVLMNCIFEGNVANYDGGGIAIQLQSEPILTNCILMGNRAGENGGGICDKNIYVAGQMEITNCTFAGNRASISGGAIHRSTMTIGLANCILWGNTASEGPELSELSEFIEGLTVSYSDVEGGWEGEGNIDSDPCFVDAGYWDPNGTPEDANDDFWVEGDYHLRWNSQCIDAGDPNFSDDPDEHDIDDEPRVMAGRVDIGADEVGPKQADLSRDGLINFKDYSILVKSFGSAPADPSWYVLSDLYEDNRIDYNDLALLIDDWLWKARWYTNHP